MTALVVTPHPMTVQGQQVLDAAAAALVPGETLASFLARHEVVPGQGWVVAIGGVDVPEQHWHRVRPKHGHLIEARRVPAKSVLRLVAFAALSWATFGMGGMAGGGFMGLTGVGGWLAAGVAYLAGSAVINKLLGPKPLKPPQIQAVSPTYTVGAGRNQARQWEPMGLVLGEPYCVPDLAAQPYTYFAGGEQFLWQIFHCGLNCASVSAIRIGQTSVDAYQGVTLSYEGFASGNTGLPALGTSVDTVAGALLDAPTSPGAWVTRTSSVDTMQLAVDIEGSLYAVDGKGVYVNATCEIEVEYRLVGSGTWLKFGLDAPYVVEVPPVYENSGGGIGGAEGDGGGFTLLTPGYSYTVTPTTIGLNNASTRPLRTTLQRTVTPGQYEVRARKVSANAGGSTAQNVINWSTLKSFQVDSGDYAGQARLGVQIQASGQLNGALDELNLMAVAKPMPYWNGTAWVTATSRANGLSNPGAIILQLARGIYDGGGKLVAGLGWDDAQIDIEGLKLFMVWCAAKGFTFDYFLQETTAIGDLLNAVAAAGLGAISFHPGTLSVVWFSDTDPVETVLNMGTFKARSFQVEYDTMETAQEIEFQYFDRNRGNAWKPLRVLAPGVTVPNSTGRQQLVGVTTEAHAAVLARFSMAQNIYQRKTVTADVDLEHLTFRRGTVMAVSHDITQWGYGGRVKAASNAAGIVTLTLDDLVPAVSPSGGTTRYVGLRLAGESQYRIFPVASFAGVSRTITLGSAWPGGVPVPGDSAGNPAHDTVWIYDFKATPGQKMRVAEISPQGDMEGARIALVPESAEFWDYVWMGAYTPPPNNSLLQAAPEVSDVLVTEQLRRLGAAYYTELTLTFAVAGSYDRAELWGGVVDSVGFVEPSTMRRLASTRGLTLSWQGGLNETWALELRAFSAVHSGEPYRLTYKVGGIASPPPPFDRFLVLAQPDGTRQYEFGYASEDAKPADWLGAEIRYIAGTVVSPDWDAMTPLLDTATYFTASPVEANAPLSGTWTFACKSVDTSGNRSTYLTQTITLNARRLGAVFEEYFEHLEGWAGTKTGCRVADGWLEAIDTTTWATMPSTWTGWTRWNLNPTSPITYVTPARDFGAAIVGGVSSEIDADGSVVQEISTSADGVTWSGWSSAALQFNARYIRLRLTVTATGPAPVPLVRSWSYQITAPIREEYLNDVVPASLSGSYRIGTGDIRVPLVGTYAVLKKVDVTIQDTSSGAWTHQRVDQALTYGPRWQFKLNGVLADPAFVDFHIQGY